jgi:hypothetical protein
LADGTPVRLHNKTQALCKGYEEHPDYEKKNKKTGESKIVPSAAVELVSDKFMQKINANAKQWNSAQVMLITDFWTKHYLLYCGKEWEGEGMKPSTLNGYKKMGIRKSGYSVQKIASRHGPCRPTRLMTLKFFFPASRRNRIKIR